MAGQIRCRLITQNAKGCRHLVCEFGQTLQQHTLSTIGNEGRELGLHVLEIDVNLRANRTDKAARLIFTERTFGNLDAAGITGNSIKRLQAAPALIHERAPFHASRGNLVNCRFDLKKGLGKGHGCHGRFFDTGLVQCAAEIPHIGRQCRQGCDVQGGKRLCHLVEQAHQLFSDLMSAIGGV